MYYEPTCKAHMEMVMNCHKLGIKVPPELDPDEPAASDIQQGAINNRQGFIFWPIHKFNNLMSIFFGSKRLHLIRRVYV